MMTYFLITSYLLLYEGYSRLINFIKPIKDIAVGNPDILAVRVLSDKEILLNALKEGVTNIIFSTEDKVEEIECVIKKRDALEFRPYRIIRVEVWVLELERKTAKEIGFDWLKEIEFEEGNIPSTYPIDVGPIKRITNLSTILKFLEEKGALKIISHPILIALEEKESEFISGGELPVLITQPMGTATMEWKEYGVKLKIKPRVDDKGYIILYLEPEVSDIDWANAIQIEGNLIPALRKNASKVEVKIFPGESVFISGLTKRTKEKFKTSIPLLGKIPIIGPLIFTSKKTQEVIKEVVFIVAPHIVPLERGTGKIHIFKEDKVKEFYIPIKIIDGNVYFELSETFKREVNIDYKWIEVGKLLEVKYGKRRSFLAIEKSTIQIDDISYTITPKIIVDDKTVYFPVSFFSIIGLSGFWDPYTSEFYILETFREKQ